jgi:hypothetical protein
MKWIGCLFQEFSFFKFIRVYTEKESLTGQTDLPQGTVVFENCLVVPGMNALYNLNGKILSESLIYRGTPPIGLPRANYEQVVDVALNEEWPVVEESIFLPYINFEHFGHSLTETAAWLYPITDASKSLLFDERKNIRFIIPAIHSSQKQHLAAYLNISSNRIISTEQFSNITRLSKVLIPRPSIINRFGMHLNHLSAVRYFINTWYGLEKTMTMPRTGHEKVYLSRARLGNNLRKIENETKLELQLSKRGWKVVHPETLPVTEQIRFLYHARVVGGNAGSAFHLLMYFGIIKPAKLAIALGKEEDFNNISPVYNMIFHIKAQHIALRYICCLKNVSAKIHPLQNDRSVHQRFIFPASRIAQKMDSLAEQFLQKNPV